MAGANTRPAGIVFDWLSFMAAKRHDEPSPATLMLPARTGTAVGVNSAAPLLLANELNILLCWVRNRHEMPDPGAAGGNQTASYTSNKQQYQTSN